MTFGWLPPLIGLIAAYLSAVIAVKWMVSYISRRGMNGFGYYRLAIGVLVILLLMTNGQ
jgi:undecaprenyl-diphosphatase